MIFRRLKNCIKNVAVILFTDYPYKIKQFGQLYEKRIGRQIDMAESTSMILSSLPGLMIHYTAEPISLNGPLNVRYLKSKPRYLSYGIFKEPDKYVYSVANGRIFGNIGLIYDAGQRTFLDESAKEWTISLKNSIYTNTINYPPKTQLNGLGLSFLTTGADGGFYHFIFESITKAYLYGPQILQEADYLFFNAPPADWKLKWLKRAEIEFEKIIWVDNYGHFQCDQLLFTNRLIEDQQIGHYCLKALRGLFKIPSILTKVKRQKKVIWISRKGLRSRELLWEKEMLIALPGILSIDLAALGANETVTLFREATHVIGAHGAGLSNIYLCLPGTVIWELYPEDITYQPCYQRLALLGGLVHRVINLDFKNKNNINNGLLFFVEKFNSLIC